MSMIGGLGGPLSPFQMEQQKPQRPAPPPQLPYLLLQQQAQRILQSPPPPPPRQSPPPTAAASAQKPRNGTQQQGTPAERNPTGRPASSARAHGGEAAQESRSGQALTSYLPVLYREPDSEQGEGHGKDEHDGGGAEARDARAASGELDCAELADELTAQAAEEGIFEVMMPDGKTLGVVVRLDDKRAQFLLSPSDDELAERLRKGKMELEGHLGRRMNKDVDISVL